MTWLFDLVGVINEQISAVLGLTQLLSLKSVLCQFLLTF